MKNLEFNRMEEIKGGDGVDCGMAIGGLSLSAASLILAEVAIASSFGPIGLAFGIGYGIAMASVALSAGSAVKACAN